jgi:hypothetical protein
MATTKKWQDFCKPEMVRFVNITIDEFESAKRENRAPLHSSYLLKIAEDVKLSALQDPVVPPKYAIKASTLIEFFSVRIETDEKHDAGSSFEIYGHIKLTSDYGKELFLFKRESHDPETVFMLDEASAILPISKPRSPHWLPKYFWLEVHLVDKTRNVTIVNDEFLLQFQHKLLYDKEQVIKYESVGYGRVMVNYEIFRLAVVAEVHVVVSNNESGTTDDIDVLVSGSISANTEVKGTRGTSSRVLYDDKSMTWTTNKAVLLSAVAVPMNSLLKIKVDLEVNDEQIVAEDDLEFESSGASHWKTVVSGNWRISVMAFMTHAYEYLPAEEFVGELISYDDYKELSKEKIQEGISDTEERSVEEDQEDCLDSKEISESEDTEEKRILPIDNGRYLLEVFSVYVGSFGDDGPLHVSGTIKYDDEDNNYTFFERDEMKPEKVFLHKPISLLKTDCCYENGYGCFQMHVDLKDAEAREISKGLINWHTMTVLRWYNKRICSFVPGEHGFACVHYAIFDDAVSAKVRVTLLCSNDHPVFKCHGNIHARYSTYRCSTHYEKKYYRSTLFEKRKSEFVEMCAPSDPGLYSKHLKFDVPLSKDVIAVPCDTSLILEVDFHVLAGGEFDETISGELTINPRESAMEVTEKMKGKNSPTCCQLKLVVEWS